MLQKCHGLLREAFDGEGPEFRILVTDLPEFLTKLHFSGFMKLSPTCCKIRHSSSVRTFSVHPHRVPIDTLRPVNILATPAHEIFAAPAGRV
jgi:hypothetical protein